MPPAVSPLPVLAPRKPPYPAIPVVLVDLWDSPFQHRTIYDVHRLEELAQSILEHGIREPPTGRPGVKDGRPGVEQAVGHRRKRATIMAELRRQGITLEEELRMEREEPETLAALRQGIAQSISIFVRVGPMTDEEVLQAQEDENFNKATPHPIEEAGLYERYLHLVNAEPAWSAAKSDALIREVARRLHKEPEHVARTIKLLGLAPRVRDRFFADEDLDIRLAFELAKLHAHPAQERAAKVVLGDPKGKPGADRPAMSLALAKKVVRVDFMLQLIPGVTPFDITAAALVEGRPPCADCDQRSGNAPTLFPELLREPDVCTNLTCYEQKRDAQWEVDVAEARRLGQKVLSKAENRAVFYPTPHEVRIVTSSPYLALDAETFHEGKKTTLRARLGKHMPPVVLANHEGHRVELVSRKDAEKMLEAKARGDKAPKVAPSVLKDEQRAAAGKPATATTPAEPSVAEMEREAAKAGDRKRKAEEAEKIQQRAALNDALLAALVKRWPTTPGRKARAALAKALVIGSWEATLAAVAKRRKLSTVAKSAAHKPDLEAVFHRHIDSLKKPAGVDALMAELILTRALDFQDKPGTNQLRLEEACLAVGVEPKKIALGLTFDGIAKTEKAKKAAGKVASKPEKQEAAPATKGKPGADGYRPAEREMHGQRVYRLLLAAPGPLLVEEIEAKLGDLDVPPLLLHLQGKNLIWWKREHGKVVYGATKEGMTMKTGEQPS